MYKCGVCMVCENFKQATRYMCDVCTFSSACPWEVHEHEKLHSYCKICERLFYDHPTFRQHYLNSSRHNFCGICNLDFRSPAARRQHYLNSTRHNYCGICEQGFSSPAALRGHQQTHLPRDVECPGCGKSFTSASAMKKHVELSKCFGLTHGQIVHKVRDWERRSGNPNLFTVPRLGYSSNDGSPGLATSAAYNGSGYECYFCQKVFFLLAHLNQHLRSGIHLPEEFRCNKCGYKATWLSALIEHIESEKCGFMTRSEVKFLATPVTGAWKRSRQQLGNYL